MICDTSKGETESIFQILSALQLSINGNKQGGREEGILHAHAIEAFKAQSDPTSRSSTNLSSNSTRRGRRRVHCYCRATKVCDT